MESTQKFLPIWFVIMVFAACDGGEDAGTGNISGIVTAARDQSPVADAEITIGSQSAKSAADGSFEISNAPTGLAPIRAEASGFVPYSGNIQIQKGQNSHNISLEKPSIYERDPFTIYVPPRIQEVRGVLLFMTGGAGDFRPWVRGNTADSFEASTARQKIIAFIETYGFALMGNDRFHYQDFFPVQTVLSALEDFAVASDHPELAHAPLLPIGYSVGGRLAVIFTFLNPDRTIGVYSYKGVIYNFLDKDWESIRSIPVFLHMGEFDTEVGSSIPIPKQFAPNREEGALWAAGIEKGVAHEFKLPVEFIITWMKALIISRTPDVATPGTIPVLNVITEESGWLGNLNTFEIRPYAEFQGDLGSTSWLPNEETAQGWRSIFR